MAALLEPDDFELEAAGAVAVTVSPLITVVTVAPGGIVDDEEGLDEGVADAVVSDEAEEGKFSPVVQTE